MLDILNKITYICIDFSYNNHLKIPFTMFFQFKREQLLHTDITTLWDFISSPENLKKITPSYMGFDITSDETPKKMYQGMIISYKVSPFLGIKSDWVTEITHVVEKKYFVDEQRLGPYNLWHHQHILIEQENGILMKDIITYAPPFGIIGYVANKLFISSKLKEIFDYRFQILEKYFNQK